MSIKHVPVQAVAAGDPPPSPPEPPLPSDCCESGCPICVHDLYAQELEAYRRALAAWKLRQPAIGPGH